jgi:hypothetical protein
MKIDVIISHALFDERRKAPMTRLAESFGDVKPLIIGSAAREHARVWAVNLWREVQRSQADVVLCLNDDVTVHPDILKHVATLAEMFPDDIISLHPNFPAFGVIAETGKRLAKSYWPSGPAMAMSPHTARDLLAWLDKIPPQFFSHDVNEDGAIASFLWSRQTPSVYTIPALVRHDITVPSTLPGYDLHPGRTSPVDWERYPPGEWARDAVMPYIPCPWMSDNQFRILGDALRGVLPLCGLCWQAPAAILNQARGTGICGACARGIAQSVMQTLIAGNPHAPGATAPPSAVPTIPAPPAIT